MMLATDFFHVDCALTLQRLYCLFVIEAGTPLRTHTGGHREPGRPWTTQQIRNLLIDLGEDPSGEPTGELLCGTVRAHRPDRGHRPDADLRPAAPADGPEWAA
jgi:hypothetical protein